MLIFLVKIDQKTIQTGRQNRTSLQKPKKHALRKTAKTKNPLKFRGLT